MNLFYLVKIKYYEKKIGIESERLSDYSIIYTIKNLSSYTKILLDIYRIITVL